LSLDRSEIIVPGPAEALAGLLGAETPVDLVPPLWHWVYLLDRPPHQDLGPDGHPRNGVVTPPKPGMKRMFAGGRITTIEPLQVGRHAQRSSRVVKTQDKVGSSGPLTFTTVRHEIVQDGVVKIIEESDIVYRSADSSLAPRPAAPAAVTVAGPASARVTIDETLLFQFSALTYNAHRIHYDRDWARAEGYADLVVHGPLQVLLMAELLRHQGVSVVGQQFSYRLVAAMVGCQTLTVAATSPDLTTTAVYDDGGKVTAQGRVEQPGA